MSHEHSIYDTDPHFKIDPDTRIITNLSKVKPTIVQGDHKSERFTFELPRFVENHDMSLCDSVQVHYINIGGSNDRVADRHDLYDLQVSPDSEDVVICSWLLTRDATSLNGTLNFALSFSCSENGEVIYSWSTLPFKDITIGQGINNSDAIAEEYADILQQWEAEINARFDSMSDKTWFSTGNSTAGIMGYYFSSIDFDTKQITLTKVQGEAPEEAFDVNYTVGDVISLNNGSKFPNCSTITAIDKNVITVDTIPFDSMIEDDDPSSDEWNFYVIEKPDVGEIRLGEFATALGELCRAIERGSISLGRGCLTYGAYGVSLGRETIANYGALSEGMLTEATGHWSHSQNYKTQAPGEAAHAQNRATLASGKDSDAGGFQTEARKRCSFTRGVGTISDSDYQFVRGKYNIIDDVNIFADIVGNGESKNKRSNAYTLDWGGNGWFAGNVTVGDNKEQLATENFVLDVINTAIGEALEADY